MKACNYFLSAYFKGWIASLISLSLLPKICATTWYVGLGGSDQNPGTSSEPFRTLRKATNVVHAGDTIRVGPGTYREQVEVPVGNSAARITLEGYGGPVILKGSEEVSGNWTHGAPEQNNSQGIYHIALPDYTQQVFSDGVPLQQIGPFKYDSGSTVVPPVEGTGVADMRAGTFFYDAVNQRLYIWLPDGTNPANHFIEATKRDWILIVHDYNTISGLAFSHCQIAPDPSNPTSPLSKGGVAVGGTGRNIVVTGCSFTHSDFAGLIIQDADNLVESCELAYNGCDGFTSSYGVRFNFLYNDVHNNNTRRYPSGWGDGGVKVVEQRDCVFRYNYFHDEPTSAALWFDINCLNVLVADNYFENCAAGISFEISRWGRLMNNVVKNCGFGIWNNGSSDVLIANNVVDNCPEGIHVSGGIRGAEYALGFPEPAHLCLAATRNTYVANNVIIDSSPHYIAISANTAHCSHNASDFNAFVQRNAQVNPLRFFWSATANGLGAWVNLSQNDQHSTIGSITDFVNPDGGDYTLTASSPLRTAGIPISATVPSIYYSGPNEFRPFAKTLVSDWAGSFPLFNIWADWHYRPQPEPAPLQILSFPASASTILGLNSTWTSSGYPVFQTVQNPVVNPLAADGLTGSDNLLIDGDFQRQTVNNTLQLPWRVGGGLCFAFAQQGLVDLHDYAQTGFIYQKIGAVTSGTYHRFTLNMLVNSYLPDVTTVSDVYFAVGPDFTPVGDTTSGHVVAGPNSAIGWKTYNIAYQSGNVSSSDIGRDLYVVIKGAISGPGINYNGGAASGRVTVDNCMVLKWPENNILGDGDFSGQVNDGWAAPWVAGGGLTYAYDGAANVQLISDAQSGWFRQSVGTVTRNTRYELRLDLRALSVVANVTTIGEAYLAVGPNYTAVGQLVHLEAAPNTSVGYNTYIVRYQSGGLEDAGVGQNLYVVIKGQITGPGINWNGGHPNGQVHADNVKLVKEPTESLITDGDFSGQANGSWTAPWNAGGGLTYAYDGAGLVQLHEYAQSGWFRQSVGTVALNTQYELRLDLKALSVVANVTTIGEAYLAVGPTYTPVGGLVHMEAAPNTSVGYNTYVVRYQSGGLEDPNVGQNLYVVIKGQITGSGINPNGGNPCGQVTADNCVLTRVPAVGAAFFDGSDRLLAAQSTSNSKKGLVSLWFKSGSSGAIIGQAAQCFRVDITGDGTLRIDGYADNTGTVITMRLVSMHRFDDGRWHHLLASWDTSDINKRHLYVDGVDEQYPIAFYNQVVYYSSTFVVGSRGDQYEPFVGELCEVMFAPGQYVDVSQPGNRAKFSSGRFPIALDFDLILGTGVRPLLYLDHPYDSFQQNSGTGGNLTLIGALTQGTPPQ